MRLREETGASRLIRELFRFLRAKREIMHNYVPRKSSKRPGEQLPLTGQRLRLEKAFALKARALEKFYQGNFFFVTSNFIKLSK